jgi:hypothetical protein
MFAVILLNCVTMAYEYPGMRKGDLDYQILWWRWVSGGRGARARAGGGEGRLDCQILRLIP